jgi:metallo-beta-lactamase family protein
MSGKVIAISGDLGHPNDPIIRAPMPLAHADYLVIDSTYGDHLRARVDPAAELDEIFASTFRRGGVAVIPCFVPGGALSILHHIACLKKIGEMEDVPVFLDSPMAPDFLDLYRRQFGEHRLTTAQASAISMAATAVSTVDGSKAITSRRGPMVIVAGSGMATGGRVLHHLKAFAPDSRNTIVLVGYQAPGTRGAALEAHASTLNIHGEDIPVRAAVKTITSLSAQADYGDLLAWLGKMSDAPDRTFVTHGAAAASDALRRRIQGQLHWRCDVPAYLESVTLPERHEDGASPAPRNRPLSVPATVHPDHSDRPVAVS